MTSLAQLDPTQTRRAIGPSVGLSPRGARRSRDRPAHRRDGRGPDVVRLVEAVARAVLEVEANRRPLSQLDGILAPNVALSLAHRQRWLVERSRRTRIPLAGPEPGSLVRVIGQQTADGAYEATALVRSGDRVTAIAIRAELYRGAWRIVAFSRPEDQPGA